MYSFQILDYREFFLLMVGTLVKKNHSYDNQLTIQFTLDPVTNFEGKKGRKVDQQSDYYQQNVVN